MLHLKYSLNHQQKIRDNYIKEIRDQTDADKKLQRFCCPIILICRQKAG